MSNAHFRRRQNGFTLIEILVALAITGLLISVLVSALFYLFRVQGTLHDEVVSREVALRGKAWFHDALTGCLPAQPVSLSAFHGSESELSCESTLAATPSPGGAPALISFRIRRGDNRTILLDYAEPGTSTQAEILSWQTDAAAFSYVDSKGKEHSDWPPPATTELLPRLVKLTVGDIEQPDLVWATAPRADPWPAPAPLIPPGMIAPK